MSSRRAIENFRPQLKSNAPNQSNAPTRQTDSSSARLPEAADRDGGASLTNAESTEKHQAPSRDEVPLYEVPAQESDPLPISSEEVAPEPVKPVKRKYSKGQLFRHVASRMTSGAKVIGVPLLWVGLAAFCGGTGFAAFSWLSTIPHNPNCDGIWFMSPTADKLYCAEQAAKSGAVEPLLAGLKLIEDWPPNHQHAAQATRLRREWTESLLQIASNKALQNDLEGAIALAKKIEPNNPLYRNANNAILEWEKLRSQEQTLTDQVEAALKVRDWKKAEAYLQPQTPQVSEYQLQQFSRLRERILEERIAYSQLQQIHQLVKNYSPNQVSILVQAVQLASKINPDSYIADQVQADVQQWSQQLVTTASTKLQQKDISGAIAAMQGVPPEMPLPPEVQELMWVYQAERLPINASLTSSPQDWLQLMTTLAVIEQVQANSPLYQRAQARIPLLKQRVQDLAHLNLATRVAQTHNIPALRVAIQLAQMIAPDRPHRIHAQTLIAKWRKDIEQMEDQPYLTDAQNLAKSGQVKDLQAAIAQASKIQLGRTLRPAAQAAIFDWRQAIQTAEDKPILEKARQLAKQNELAKAIQTAGTINAERVLHPEAQNAIRTWTSMMQMVEDRPILDEAKALAAQGRLGVAIDVAYQIAPGRALYDAAQKEITNWYAQLEATRRSRYESDRVDNLNNSESSNQTY